MNISVWCPLCDLETEHEVLREANELTVRCMACGHVHRTMPEPENVIVVRAIVSDGKESHVCSTELDKDENYRRGDSVVVECEKGMQSVEITGIETQERRAEHAIGSEISTLWTRTIREVTVKVSLHEGRKTIPLYYRAGGEERFEVGSEYTTGTRRFRISHIKLRNDRFLRRAGEKAVAKDIKRIYAFRS